MSITIETLLDCDSESRTKAINKATKGELVEALKEGWRYRSAKDDAEDARKMDSERKGEYHIACDMISSFLGYGYKKEYCYSSGSKLIPLSRHMSLTNLVAQLMSVAKSSDFKAPKIEEDK